MGKRKRAMPAALKRYWANKRRKLKPQRLRPKARGGKHMARRRRAKARYSRRGSGGFGGNKLMRGIFPIGGVIGAALVGAGISTLQAKFLPQMIPYQGPAAGFVVAGIPGAAGAFLRDMFAGTTVATTGGGW